MAGSSPVHLDPLDPPERSGTPDPPGPQDAPYHPDPPGLQSPVWLKALCWAKHSQHYQKLLISLCFWCFSVSCGQDGAG